MWKGSLSNTNALFSFHSKLLFPLLPDKKLSEHAHFKDRFKRKAKAPADCFYNKMYPGLCDTLACGCPSFLCSEQISTNNDSEDFSAYNSPLPLFDFHFSMTSIQEHEIEKHSSSVGRKETHKLLHFFIQNLGG